MIFPNCDALTFFAVSPVICATESVSEHFIFVLTLVISARQTQPPIEEQIANTCFALQTRQKNYNTNMFFSLT